LNEEAPRTSLSAVLLSITYHKRRLENWRLLYWTLGVLQKIGIN